MFRVVRQAEWYSVEQCEANEDTLYVFGDNSMQTGMAGQAVIRKCGNSFGIPTKRYPIMDDRSFFRDTESDKMSVMLALTMLSQKVVKGKYSKLVFPADGLGTGLAMMPIKSPLIYKYLNDGLKLMFGLDLGVSESIG